MMTHPIVVGYDASEGANAALRWALDDGSRTGTQLTLLFAFEWQAIAGPATPGPSSWPDHGARDDAQRMIDAAVTSAFHPASP